MEVCHWKCDILSHAPVLINDTQHGPIWRMVADHYRVWMLISFAETIDLPNNSLAKKVLIITFFYSPNKFMSKDAVVSRHIALDNFQVL